MGRPRVVRRARQRRNLVLAGRSYGPDPNDHDHHEADYHDDNRPPHDHDNPSVHHHDDPAWDDHDDAARNDNDRLDDIHHPRRRW